MELKRWTLFRIKEQTNNKKEKKEKEKEKGEVEVEGEEKEERKAKVYFMFNYVDAVCSTSCLLLKQRKNFEGGCRGVAKRRVHLLLAFMRELFSYVFERVEQRG